MSVMLTLLGIVVAAAGVAAIGFGIPINDFSLGSTLIISGSTALVGGLLLIGLGAVAAELNRLVQTLSARGASRAAAAEIAQQPPTGVPSMVPAGPAMAAGAAPPTGLAARPPQRGRPEAPAREPRSPGVASKSAPAAAPSTLDVSAAAIERLRSTIPRNERTEPPVVTASEEVPLSPNEVLPQQISMSGGAAALEPKVTEADRAGGGAVETLRASRLDFLFRSKPAGRAPSQAQNADAALASESRSATTAEQEPQPASVGPVQDRPEQAASEPEHQAEAASVAETAPSATILKSGIVDGMAYTLYADGSIEAALPDGTVRFGSIAELRAHIESNS